MRTVASILLAVLCAAVSVPAGAWTTTNGGDHLGADWTPLSGTVIAGFHTNIGTFAVPPGATVTVRPYDGSRGWVRIRADRIDIWGTLSADLGGYPGAGAAAGAQAGSGGSGPGAGGSGSVTTWDFLGGSGAGGGGHGGWGGTGGDARGNPAGWGGIPYGSASAYDAWMGSGGGGGGGGGNGRECTWNVTACGCNTTWGSGGAAAGAGGGVVWLEATTSVRIAGTVRANGGAGGAGGQGATASSCLYGGEGWYGDGGGGGGGGAGGTVIVRCEGAVDLSGGVLRADGGPGGGGGTSPGTFDGNAGEWGGGGRIKLFSGSLNATGATLSASGHESGTTFTESIPLPPGNLAGTVHAVNSITWTWTDAATGETGYEVVSTAGSASLPANSVQWIQTGLAPNTCCTLFVRARNAGNRTFLESRAVTAAVYTSIGPPVGILFGNVTDNDIQAKPLGDLDNLGRGASAAIVFCSNTGTGGVVSSGWMPTKQFFNFGGLVPNTIYHFWAQARNGDGDLTAVSSRSPKRTLGTPPLPNGFGDITETTVTVRWLTGGNPPGTEYLAQAVSTVFISPWTTANEYTFTGLRDGVNYTFRVKARDAGGYETDWATIGSVTTVAFPPRVLSLAPELAKTNEVVAVIATGADYQLGVFITLQHPSFGSIPGSAITYVGETRIDCTFDLAGAATGVWNVYVENPDGKGSTTTNAFRIHDEEVPLVPDQVTNVSTLTSIQWTWRDRMVGETGYIVWTNAARPPIRLPPDTTGFFLSGLPPNTVRTLLVAVENLNNTTVRTSRPPLLAPAYSAIEVPGGLLATGFGPATITVSPFGSPSHLDAGASGVLIYCTTLGLDSGWRNNLGGWALSGLSPNTPYRFYAVARNGGGQLSAPGPTFTKHTLAATPAILGFPTITDTSITIDWFANGNPAGTEYWIETIVGGSNSSWITNTAYTFTGLAPSSDYGFKAKARNGDGDETYWVGLGNVRTIIFPPEVRGVFPDRVANVGSGVLQVRGTNFYAGLSVELIRVGAPAISADPISLSGKTNATCTFPLTGARVGSYGVRVVNVDSRSNVLADAVTIVQAPAPVVDSVDPATTANNAEERVTVRGRDFFEGARIELYRLGEAEITGVDTILTGETNIAATLDLTGKRTGKWDVVVRNVDGQSGALQEGLTILRSDVERFEIWNNYADPSADGPFVVYFKSRGGGEKLAITIYDLAGRRVRVYAESEYPYGVNAVEWDGNNDDGLPVPAGTYVLNLVGGEINDLGKIYLVR